MIDSTQIKEIIKQTTEMLRKQGDYSYDTSVRNIWSGCRYRGPNGKKCAAGHWIRDEDYLPEMEGKSVLSPIVNEALVKNGLEKISETYVLERLQTIHDTYAENRLSFENMLRKMSEIKAEDFV